MYDPQRILDLIAKKRYKLVDVYTLNGALLRSRVSSENALNGLQPGVYVVNGKKVVKK